MATTFQYQLLPDLSQEEYEALKADIAARGVMVPVEYDEQGNVLDGHHRLKACQELGLKEWPRVVRLGMSEDQKREHVLALNLDRRHLSKEQRAELVARLRGEGWSTRRIADRLHVSQPTVLRDLEGDTNVSPEIITGKDGKEYPAERQERPKPVSLFNPTKTDVNRASQVLEAAEQEPERYGDLLGALERPGHINTAFRLLQAREKTGEAVEWPTGKYSVIYADPPWQYEHVATDNRAIENNYPTMTLEDICALPVADIAADDCMLFLWATSPKLAEAMRLIEAWGFSYRTCMVWVKDKIGMGYYVRQQHELILICKRGEPPVPLPANRPSSVIYADRGAHSEKPDEVYGLIERMYPNMPMVELFARTERDGWHTWGNQVGSIA